jgi:hypothetical protein
LQPKDAGDGSAVFNIARNLGGSLGTALLDTIVTRREQFHDFQIGAFINNYRPLVADRVQALTTVFVNKGYDSVTATQQAYAQIKNVVRENAYIWRLTMHFWWLPDHCWPSQFSSGFATRQKRSRRRSPLSETL